MPEITPKSYIRRILNGIVIDNCEKENVQKF